jgi:hypothetical protein
MKNEGKTHFVEHYQRTGCGKNLTISQREGGDLAVQEEYLLLSLLAYENYESHMCVELMGCDQQGGSKGWVRGGAGPALCKMRQFTCSMGY